MIVHKVKAGPYTLELKPNCIAILYEDGHQLPGGIGLTSALVQFAEEVLRLRAMLDSRAASHDRLLAAAKTSIALADKNVMYIDDNGMPTPCRTSECKEVYDLVIASIAAAEELA